VVDIVEWALRWGVGFVGGGLSSLPLHLLNLFLVRPLNFLDRRAIVP
jgi:hypothetical protein